MITDEEAEAFLDQDLSDLDLSQFLPLTWETSPKSIRINMRLPEPLLTVLKANVVARGIPYQRLIRETLEAALKQERRLRGGHKPFRLVNTNNQPSDNQPLFKPSTCGRILPRRNHAPRLALSLHLNQGEFP